MPDKPEILFIGMIHPGFLPYHEAGYGTKHRFNLMPHKHAIPALIAWLRENGCEGKYVWVDPNDKDHVKKASEAIDEFRPHAIGFSLCTDEIKDNYSLLKGIKKKYPDLPAILGGPHASAIPEHTLANFPLFDYVAIGEGERTLTEWLQRIAAGQGSFEMKEVKGLGFRENGNIVINAPREMVSDVNIFPIPAYDVLIPEGADMTEEAMPLVCSYGCRFHCIFCGADHHNFRFLKPESFVDRIEMVQKKYGTKYIAIRDSFWPPSHDWLEGFFNEIERRNLKFEFQFLSKAGALNERQLRKLFEIGARVTMYGVEAGDPAILKTVKKGITIDMARKNGRLLHDAGIYAVTFFIFGFKGENRQTIQASINLAAELNPGVSYFTPLAPLPGTEVYDQTPESDRDWWMREGTRPSLCELSPEELDRLSKEAFIRYPLRWSYLKQNVFFGNLPHEYRRIAWRFFTVQLRKYIPGILERYAFFRLIIHGIKSAMKRG